MNAPTMLAIVVFILKMIIVAIPRPAYVRYLDWSELFHSVFTTTKYSHSNIHIAVKTINYNITTYTNKVHPTMKLPNKNVTTNKQLITKYAE